MTDWSDAVAVMAAATSHFVQDPYASEALDALVGAGWSIEPPAECSHPVWRVSRRDGRVRCGSCGFERLRTATDA